MFPIHCDNFCSCFLLMFLLAQVLVDDLPPDFLSSFPNLQHLSLVASTPKSLAK